MRLVTDKTAPAVREVMALRKIIANHELGATPSEALANDPLAMSVMRVLTDAAHGRAPADLDTTLRAMPLVLSNLAARCAMAVRARENRAEQHGQNVPEAG